MKFLGKSKRVQLWELVRNLNLGNEAAQVKQKPTPSSYRWDSQWVSENFIGADFSDRFRQIS